ncbi:CD4+ T cell-stimulating antigen, lipoprotein [Paenibacillus mucilaginosus 3016]|uniref:CD4+ T cell-stimulating antigen, lipoprotein n=1 Tax=Paenibacillus mucilaginosus 3016 TaxID=1116391 RepID=H6NPT7_9BACL|nr:BMP family ABC transporter substrate-binding protein [Paenibacillus mucilaginosus]AFC33443.1 CD4+ T cell-stimulating antigen, lipoprotein [Paenibacillus mucilaginosus 3016]WFA21855.1 BMP family ABC transporter substrate-binding protein [Paenibacillus mucilaginosus]
MRTWISRSAITLLVLLLTITGCGRNAGNNGTAGTGDATGGTGTTAGTEGPAGGNQAGAQFNIGMVTDVGGVNDNSFNQSAWEGLQKLEKDTGAKVKYLQSKSDAEYLPNLNQMVKGNFNLTWGIGFIIGDAMKTVAAQNPNAKLAIIDNVVDAPNVASITFAENEGSYLVGVVAGLMTKTNKIGFVGGIDIPVIKRFEAGFRAGVTAVNPQAKLTVNYTGAFDKPDLGKAAAATLYNDGADIIFHASGATGNGVFNEAKDRAKSGQKVWVIGVDQDQSKTFGDDVTLTSMMKRVDQAVYRVSNDLIGGKYEGGKTTVLGLKDDGVGLPETSTKNVPADVLKKVDEYKQRIISGEIKVPEQ